MTVTATAPDHSPASNRREHTLIAVRFVLVVAATVGAFWNMWLELAEDVGQGSDIGYVFAVPALATLAAIGIALRRGPELPIYDRQTDVIVGLLGLCCTAALLGLLVLRYPYEYEVLHLDLLAATLFLMSASVLAFGLRPVFRYWPVWLLALIMSIPTLYREAVITLGGTRFADGAAMLIPAFAAGAIAAGRTRPRALAGGVIALGAGAIVLAAMTVWFPSAPIIAYQLIPPIAGTYTSTTVMYFHQREWATLRALDRPILPPTAKRSRSATVTILVAAGLIAFIPNPREYVQASPYFPGLRMPGTPAVAPGWKLLGEREYPWAPRYFGPRTIWARQQWQAQRGNPEWDKESRRRRLMVDIVRADNATTIDRYPEFMMYQLNEPRVSAPVHVDIGHGITARLNTVLDDRQLLSWTWLSWRWQGPDGAQRISLIAADNHLPDARFPQPEPSVPRTFETFLHQILRGRAVELDPEADDIDIGAEHKDRDMLTTVAREIVRNGVGG
ncbi:hypothetical protein JK358_25965 [Nocardia sp. 2]|uniref:Uncharacterized protein n=1 Tax=Nocardia acididurans TaxID=2802282 RepID=A0ABS1MB18_9NOCA|nr:hypothetical protein [Nocardia acididurans]MBL1077855.1 hypothetical protein [Nocardia acididurans]